MIARFFRAFFWGLLVASLISWLYLGITVAEAQEAILVEDLYSGIDEHIIGPGEIRFLPTRAFPNRIRLHRVNIGPRIMQIRFRHGLAQSEVLGLDESFYVKINFRLVYALSRDRLIPLFERLDRPDWDRLDEYHAKRLDFFLKGTLARFYRGDRDIPALEERFRDFLNQKFIGELNDKSREDGFIYRNILVEKIYIPDAGRYQSMVEAGQEIIRQKISRIKTIDQARAREYSELITDRAYFARLEKIGRLLQKYPQLREYLAIDRLSKNVEVMVVPSEKWYGRDGMGEQPVSPRKWDFRLPGRGENTHRKKSPPLPESGSAEKFVPPGTPANRFVDLTPP